MHVKCKNTPFSNKLNLQKWSQIRRHRTYSCRNLGTQQYTQHNVEAVWSTSDICFNGLWITRQDAPLRDL